MENECDYLWVARGSYFDPALKRLVRISLHLSKMSFLSSMVPHNPSIECISLEKSESNLQCSRQFLNPLYHPNDSLMPSRVISLVAFSQNDGSISKSFSQG